ncbi:MAG: 4-(cytidine 5'-diphospho)-2-C-methyl-D-erythritol kinase [Acidobacteria bacterium]|nr:4-(cytidine 5'-diphospho)-2-C-methyl-D-erythritol kinase [Acidobacteriota bacterium]
MSDTKFTLPAFAKINLTLRVLGRRADGYHEIQTILQTITLQDNLTFEALEGERLELICTDPQVPADESNLVHRAATALRERFGIRRGARVVLEKSIPAGGGLGGGSSDAAVALLGLSRLWEIRLDKFVLTEIGAPLGADVPYFFTGGTALGTGTGTIITPLQDIPRQHLVVVAPDVKISTAEAYKALNASALTKAERAVMLPISRVEPQFSDSLHEVMRNDFEAVVFRLYPEIERARNALLECGARRALLSGSGSSVFGIFDGMAEAGHARDALSGKVNWRVFVCATLTRAEYLKALGRCAALL